MHTYVDERTGRWASSFFYDQQPRADIRKDILDADATVREVIGRRPAGFRTPHLVPDGLFRKTLGYRPLLLRSWIGGRSRWRAA
jgi:hypothetical protein